MPPPPPRPSSVAEGDMGVLQARVRELQAQVRGNVCAAGEAGLCLLAWVSQQPGAISAGVYVYIAPCAVLPFSC